jgi:peptide-methionine (S)-S-oxide reductase
MVLRLRQRQPPLVNLLRFIAPTMNRAFAPLALLISTAACQPSATAEEAPRLAPAAARAASEAPGLKTAIFAGGCYWGVEGVFSHVTGVTSAVSGFHGGSGTTADYELVSAGSTGHAEAVQVTYDPAKVRYDQLLRIFFSVVADPTTLNRQGPDSGTQYRSALVPQSEEQRAVAAAYLTQLGTSRLWPRRIVTRIEEHRRFYPAEVYHQDFMLKNPRHGYIVAWDAPKVDALKTLFPTFYKTSFTPG